MYKANLCDLRDFVLILNSKDIDPCNIIVTIVGEGKTNANKVVFGRVMRHKDPRLCDVCALFSFVSMLERSI